MRVRYVGPSQLSHYDAVGLAGPVPRQMDKSMTPTV